MSMNSLSQPRSRFFRYVSGAFISVITSTTGAITLENSLDREEDPLITLTVSAHDSGVPSEFYRDTNSLSKLVIEPHTSLQVW